MALLKNIKPVFWSEAGTTKDDHLRLFDYVRTWKYALVGAASISLLPLITIFIINQYAYKNTIQGEMLRPIYTLLSNTQRSVTTFLSERQSALSFIARETPFEELSDEKRLLKILASLKASFGEFVDLGLVDSEGVEITYAGPGKPVSRNYREQDWFKRASTEGAYVGGTFRGVDGLPHFIIAVTHKRDNGDFYVLRAGHSAKSLETLVRSLRLRPSFDAFIVDQEGFLQTTSRYSGKVFDRLPFALPSPSGRMEVREFEKGAGESIILGQAPIEGTPFKFVTVAPREALMGGWFSRSGHFVGIFIGIMVFILIVILGVVTKLVSRIYVADRRRVAVLHNIQYTNKMASIGRLSAGVAHEINNPLAIINEKAGLLRDLFIFKKDISPEKFLAVVDSIIVSVKRCSTITHRLLGFARHIDVVYETIHLDQVIKEVLTLIGKESEYRSISINLQVEESLPPIESDLGQMEQVFLNIINNAFAAVDDEGRVDIELFSKDPETVSVRITDDGCGISEENMKHIFDPFFSTKGDGGTGLGLSITYGIAQKLGGHLDVKSKVGEGSSFTVTLPIKKREETITSKESSIEGFIG